MPELLIELFSEEIPARMQANAAAALKAALDTHLAYVSTGKSRAVWGPRRLAYVADEVLSVFKPAAKVEYGPRTNAPDRAVDGFLTKFSAKREDLVEREGKWSLTIAPPEEPTADLLARALPAVLRNFPWPKSMRWGTSPFLWVRPLQRVVCILGGEVLRFPVEHGVVSGDETEGHRVLAPGAFRVTGFADYLAGLRDRKVVLDAAERATLIRDGIAALAAAEGLEVVPDDGLLAEVSGLVEWPVPLLGSIDAAFMDLPPEVMRTTMRINQKYFALRTPDGRAAPRFALVANITATDGGKALVAGNERVLRARLSDARFFWDLDRKQKLEDYLPKLETVVFHAKLGTQGERVERLSGMAALIATWVKAEPNLAARAAQLAKADLASGMVGEFPELQGVMGRYYAQQGGESEEVSDAVRDHYKPVGAGDEVPRAATTVAVAIADKVDQISGFFLVGEKPSGSSDPFALRRAALGLIRIIRDSGLRLSLREVLLRSAGAIERQMAYAKHEKEYPYPDPNLNVSEPMWGHLEDMSRTAYEEATRGLTHARPYIKYDMPHEFSDEYPEFFSERVQATATEVLDFLFDRLRVQLRAEGARHDVVAAILGNSPDDDLTRLLARADALRALVESEDGANLLAAYRRAANILRIEEKKDAASYTGAELNPAELTLPEEQALAAALDQAVPEAARLLAAENFAEAMAALATLRAPLDAFFDKVLVNEPQFRRNRLALLARLRAAMESVADLSKLEG